jgi:hypothetical protein
MERDDFAALFARVCAFDVDRDESAERLVKLGAQAVTFLVSQIHDPKHGWQAVRLLGEIGPDAASCADVLHHELWHATTEPGRAWPARALAKMGRLDLVLPLFDEPMPSLHAPPAYPTGHYCLVLALLVLRPHSYEQLDRCAQGPQAYTVRECMKPGSSSYTVAVDDVGVCVAAFKRFGVEVRRDVICNVTSVAPPGRKAAAALLVAACDDVDADVRRLAVWGLQVLGKRLARPHSGRLQAMQNDSDAGVRGAAEATLRWLA